MLVEDDNNLREIYEARLMAEGYEIVCAKDGEEALALAVKERPDLIISDVMMPKISGFDMLDILRTTPETRDTKVIMMTALSQAEDKARADKLGADRYLVKSQVTLEDVARVASEVLTGEVTAEPPADPSTPTQPTASSPTPPNAAAPATPTTVSTPAPTASTVLSEPVLQPVTAAPATQVTHDPAVVQPPDDNAASAVAPLPTPLPTLVTTTTTDDASSSTPVADVPDAQSANEEQHEVEDQINTFVEEQLPVTPPPAAEPVEAPLDEPAVDTTPPQPQADAVEAINRAISNTADAHPADAVPESAESRKKVITPINDLSAKPDLHALAAQEEARAVADNPPVGSVFSANGGAEVPPAAQQNGAGNGPQPGQTVDPNSIAL